MRSPEAAVVRRAPLHPLLAKELREIVSGRALWTMLLILCPLVGYGFWQAVVLYGEASTAARNAPVLASGLSPLDGVLVPTFGALYVAVTFLFPFVAIRSLGREKETGALRLLLQLPYQVPTLVAAKMAAIFGAWLVVLIPTASAVVIWAMLGGHLYVPETANLVLGHLLYGLLVGAIALFAASISESSATAAIVALAFTIGSWVLDFALAGQPGALEWLSRLSLTQTLRTFEQGLLSPALLLGVMAAICGFAALSAVWLHPGVPLRTKVHAFDRLRGRRCSRACTGHAGQDIDRPHRGSAQLVSSRRSAGARRASRAAARHRSVGAGRPALCRSASQRSGQARAGASRRQHSPRHDRPKRRGQQQRRGLWRDRIFLCGPRRQEPLDQPARNPAAALCACGKADTASGHRGRVSGLPLGRRRTMDPAVVPRRPPAADRHRLVAEPPSTTIPAQLIKEGAQA